VMTLTPARLFAKTRALDPRWYQIACLSTLLLYGVFVLRFDLGALQAVTTVGVALLAQWACTRLWKLPAFEVKSALISSLSLCLLLRTNLLWLAAAAAVLAISSKFLLRARVKHILNPTNGALVMLLAIGAPIWVSPGQWGSFAFFAFLLACLGGLVVMRSARADVALAFLCFWCVGLFGRSLWIGEPLTIPLNRLENGALLLFAFFMISDPKTTPDSRAGRLLFAFVVAAGAWWIQFALFRTNGLLWSLAASSLLVPLIDRVLPGRRYSWAAPHGGAARGADPSGAPPIVPVSVS
jgi:enediyne biosynthesis protein E5